MKTDSFLKKAFICASCEAAAETSYKEMKHQFPYLDVQYLLAEEELWPFRDNYFDLVVSNLNHHLNNDSVAALSRVLDSLKPDGIFCGNTYGRATLEELRTCLFLAENERSGGMASHLYQ